MRVPQVRYTMPLAPWGFLGAFSVSAESPETDAWLPATGIIGQDATSGANAPSSVANTGFNPLKTPAPDLTAAWYVPQPWGHFDVSAVVRPALRISDGVFVDKTYTGWGVHVGGDVKTPLVVELGPRRHHLALRLRRRDRPLSELEQRLRPGDELPGGDPGDRRRRGQCAGQADRDLGRQCRLQALLVADPALDDQRRRLAPRHQHQPDGR